MAFVVDREGLRVLYGEQAGSLLVFFVRRTYDPQLAMDLIGETFARAFERRGRFRGASEREAAAWLWGIARHVLADALRRGRAERRALRRLGLEAPALAPDVQAEVERRAGLHDLRLMVLAALETLAPEQREALRLRVVLELDYAAVAERLGISQQAARARVSRGLRALAGSLDVAEGVP
jgi:RNA polymerase sigma-70 factor (ECF subfamily)